MLVYAKDYDSSVDYQIQNSFETHLQSPGLNQSKRNIGNIKIRPTQEYLFVGNLSSLVFIFIVIIVF